MISLIILQLLPGASEETIVSIENALKTMPSVTDLMVQQKGPKEMIDILSSNTAKFLDQRDIKYECHCSKERFKTSLMTLDKASLEQMLLEDKQIEIICHFCHSKYVFDEEELKVLIAAK